MYIYIYICTQGLRRCTFDCATKGNQDVVHGSSLGTKWNTTITPAGGIPAGRKYRSNSLNRSRGNQSTTLPTKSRRGKKWGHIVLPILALLTCGARYKRKKNLSEKGHELFGAWRNGHSNQCSPCITQVNPCSWLILPATSDHYRVQAVSLGIKEGGTSSTKAIRHQFKVIEVKEIANGSETSAKVHG